MAGIHARLAPSASHRWLECPGSVTLTEGLRREGVPEKTSEYADEGTILHDITAERLPHVRATRETSFDHLLGRTYKGEVVTLQFDETHADACQSCAQCALDVGIAAPLTVAFIEQRVWIPGRDDCFGTTDLAVLDRPLRTLYVTDWKFGMGVRVFARENPQAIIYALGLLLAMDGIEDVDRVVIIIHQPRLDHHDRWEISADELRSWLPRILAGAARTDVDRTEYHDGDWCQFCPAKTCCPKLRASALELAKREFSRVESATVEELAEAMRAIPKIESFIKAVEAEVLKRMAGGEAVPGFKTVEGRRSRSYTDELVAGAFAKQYIGDAAFTSPQLRTPAQLEAIAKRMKIGLPEDLFSWSRGGLHVAPDSDRRLETTSAKLDFNVIPDDNDL